MKHLNEIAALSRCALVGDGKGSTEAVERLLEALMSENATDTEAIDTLLTIWDRARMERLNNPMRGMKLVPIPQIIDAGHGMPPKPHIIWLRIACPGCGQRFWLHSSYNMHWLNIHLSTHSHQRI